MLACIGTSTRIGTAGAVLTGGAEAGVCFSKQLPCLIATHCRIDDGQVVVVAETPSLSLSRTLARRMMMAHRSGEARQAHRSG